MTRIRCLTVLALAFATSGALAQSITFYESEGYRGRSFSQDGPIVNFERFGFNDRASSVVIRRGTWDLCSDAHFGGGCVTLRPGGYPNLGAMGMSNRVSSARPVSAGAHRPENRHVARQSTNHMIVNPVACGEPRPTPHHHRVLGEILRRSVTRQPGKSPCAPRDRLSADRR